MKRLIFFSLVVLIITANADDDIVLEEFGVLNHMPRISNGTVSELTPYAASIRLLSEEMNKQFGFGHFCGGVFISRTHVLTLASCLERTKIVYSYELQIVGGTRYRYDSTDAQILSAKEIVIHPEYSINDISNNLAIIFVSTSSLSLFLSLKSYEISKSIEIECLIQLNCCNET